MLPFCKEDIPRVTLRAQKFLAGLRYPVSKDQILAYGRQQSADEEVMFALYGLAERAYESPADVSGEIARQLRRFAPRGS
jgi:hypothetical protein